MDPAREKRLESYEGLVFATARRYCDYLDYELEDVQQLLRLKVWRALCSFDPAKYSGPRETAERRYVFTCVRNGVKDLLKEQARRIKRERGTPLFIEDVSGEGDGFEHRHGMAVDAELIFAVVEEENIELPSTLTELERQVVGLLLIGYERQTEMARELGVSRQRVRSAHASVKVKMEDWRPSGRQRPALQVA